MSLMNNPGKFAGLLYTVGSIPGFFALKPDRYASSPSGNSQRPQNIPAKSNPLPRRSRNSLASASRFVDSLEQIIQSQSNEDKYGLADEVSRDAETKKRLVGSDVVGGCGCISMH
jgi:hypothetical protein